VGDVEGIGSLIASTLARGSALQFLWFSGLQVLPAV